MKCLICENIYPAYYKKCPICDNNLVKEKFAPQIKEVEEVQPISAFAVNGDIDDIGGNL